MCKLIAELVDTDKHVLREMLNRLEHASGDPGIDVRFTGEIYGTLHMKMRELGLDPNDTTPRELYGALLNLAALHDSFLASKIGITDLSDSEAVLVATVAVVNRMNIPKQAWVFKPVVVRRLLNANPPKTVMKLLRYRSLDSLLKREPMARLLTIARHVEPDAWQQRFTQSYKKLKPSDFEVRDIEVTYLRDQRWQAVSDMLPRTRQPIIYSPEVGCVAVLSQASTPAPKGLTLTSLLLILHYINEIRATSTYYKLHQVRPDFGKFLVEAIHGNLISQPRIAGQPLHWRIVHRYYGNGARLNHPELFEPHVQPEDVAYRKAETVLYRLEPALHFWHDLDYVGLPQQGGAISFNLTDVVLNLLNAVPYDHHVNYHMRDAVWNELYTRYLGRHSLERQLLAHLDEQLLPEIGIAQDMELTW